MCIWTPRKINECLKREHYEMPRREDIEAELAGARFFSRLDAKSGFHQIPLDDETSRICTFTAPFGRYRFVRLPFGIESSSEVFQKTMSQIFDALPGVRVFVDDILIWAPTRKEHDERLRAVLEAARNSGLTLNAAKCEIGVTKISFLGDVISRRHPAKSRHCELHASHASAHRQATSTTNARRCQLFFEISTGAG